MQPKKVQDICIIFVTIKPQPTMTSAPFQQSQLLFTLESLHSYIALSFISSTRGYCSDDGLLYMLIIQLCQIFTHLMSRRSAPTSQDMHFCDSKGKNVCFVKTKTNLTIIEQAAIPDFPCSELDWFCCLDAMGLRPVDQRRTYFPIGTFINSRSSSASYVERV